MSISDIKKRLYHYWRTYGTLNNMVILVAVVIATSWAWGSISTIQTNFAAQKELDQKQQELKIAELEVQTLKYQQNYYKSDEYKDLAARKDLGLASPGEDVLILPPNSKAVVDEDAADSATTALPATAQPKELSESNFDQWISFLSGGNAQGVLQK